MAAGIWHQTTVQQVAGNAQVTAQSLPSRTKRTLAASGSALLTANDDHKRQRTAGGQGKELPRLGPSLIESLGRSTGGPTEYTQRKAFQATPSSSIDPLLSLSHRIYDLPAELIANFSDAGIRCIYPWQKQCLLGPGILEGSRNLVYSAPTGGGKSLVADVLMIKRVLADRSAKALLVLPYVALVQEKVQWLRRVLDRVPTAKSEELGSQNALSRRRNRPETDTVRVVASFGGSKVKMKWHDFDIAVCTIEKANMLINSAIEECTAVDLKVIGLDELHMVADGHRGYLIEMLATKLLCLESDVQIVGMSATLTNIEVLAKWLQGHSYKTNYRPIPVQEHLVCDGKVYRAETTEALAPSTAAGSAQTLLRVEDSNPTRIIKPSASKELQDPVRNAVVALACETVLSGYGVLVFSGGRAACENDSMLLGRVLATVLEPDADTRSKRLDMIGHLQSLPTGIDPLLERTIPSGVVFHHAGLTSEERDIIATAYDTGVVKACVATCSLAAGINLPARRVILHNARMGREMVGPAMLRQMRGRAGRKGKDEVGETYLCCRETDLEDVVDLMQAELPLILSCLSSDTRRLRRALLEVIAIHLATSQDALEEYIKRTLLYHTADGHAALQQAQDCLAELCGMQLITKDQSSGYHATRLGKAIVASALEPEDGVFIHEELSGALRAFVMDGDMHVLYNFTPINDLSTPIDWRVFYNEMERFDDSAQRVLAFLGLKPTVLNKMLHGGSLGELLASNPNMVRRYHRFYLALQLRDLCNEMPVHRVAQKYNVSRGSVQTLGQTCQGFAAGMVKFCETMDWGAMAAALDHFSDRLRAGARADLLALAKIAFVKSRTARVFWENGFRSVAVVANADPAELVPVLAQAQPSRFRLGSQDGERVEEKLMAKAEIIVQSANRLWQNEMQRELLDAEE
jgi:replicative superfamily II helicase